MIAFYWIIFYIWQISLGFTHVPAIALWSNHIGTAITPLLFFVGIRIATLLSSSAPANRYARISAIIKADSNALQESVDTLIKRLEYAQKTTHEQEQKLRDFGLDTSSRIHENSLAMSSAMDRLKEVNTIITQSGEASLRRMERLLAGMPKIDAIALQLTENARKAGKAAHEYGVKMETQIISLAEKAATADAEAHKTVEAVLTRTSALLAESQAVHEAVCATVQETESQSQKLLMDFRNGHVEIRQGAQEIAQMMESRITQLLADFGDGQVEIHHEAQKIEQIIESRIAQVLTNFKDGQSEIHQGAQEIEQMMEAHIAQALTGFKNGQSEIHQGTQEIEQMMEAHIAQALTGFKNGQSEIHQGAQEIEQIIESRIAQVLTGFKNGQSEIHQGAQEIEQIIESRIAHILTGFKNGQSEIHQGAQEIEQMMEARIAQLHQKLSAECSEINDRFGQAIATAQESNESLDKWISSHSKKTEQLTANITSAMNDADPRLDRLHADLNKRSSLILTNLKQLGENINTYFEHAETVYEPTEALLHMAETMHAMFEAYPAMLKIVRHELEENIPHAIEQINELTENTDRLLSGLRDPLEFGERVARTTTSSLKEAQNILNYLSLQIGKNDILRRDELKSDILRLGELKDSITETDAIVQESKANLISIHAVAQDTQSQTRDAIKTVVESAANEIHESVAQVIETSLQTEIITHLSEIEKVSVRATETATGASYKLMQELNSLMQTCASVEKRVAATDHSIVTAERKTLSKQLDLLAESLKSTAIDINKILSGEVSDTAWNAYLKGDHGIFSRRAVKLLDSSEIKEILRLYKNDAMFRDSVNQYIHDFEEMLRSLIGARSGSAISVTLLSSDIGKLYVALAQAIDRLRT